MIETSIGSGTGVAAVIITIKRRPESDIIRSAHVDYQSPLVLLSTRGLTAGFGDSLLNPCRHSLKLAVPRSNLISAAQKTIRDLLSSALLNKEYRGRRPLENSRHTAAT